MSKATSGSNKAAQGANIVPSVSNNVLKNIDLEKALKNKQSTGEANSAKSESAPASQPVSGDTITHTGGDSVNVEYDSARKSDLANALTSLVEGVLASKPAVTANASMKTETPAEQPATSELNPSVSTEKQSGMGGSGYVHEDAGQEQQDSNNLNESTETAIPEQQEQKRESRAQYNTTRTQESIQQIEESHSWTDWHMKRHAERAEKYASKSSRKKVMSAGTAKMSAPAKRLSREYLAFPEAKKRHRDQKKLKVKRKSYSGDQFWDKYYADHSIRPDEVSVGIDDIRASIREPHSRLIDWINEYVSLRADIAEFTREELLTPAGEQRLIDAVNGIRGKDGSWIQMPLNIEVVIDKSPVNHGPSIQVRILRISTKGRRGFGLHPTQTKGLNADFDGDEGSVNLDQRILKYYSRSMSWLLDLEGDACIDPDFFPIVPVAEDATREDVARSMLDHDFSWLYSLGKDAVSEIDKIADAYIRVSNSSTSKELKENWRALIKALSNAAGRISGRYNTPGIMMRTKERYTWDHTVSELIYSTYEFSRRIDSESLSFRFKYLTDEYNSEITPVPDDAEPMIYDLVRIYDAITMGVAPPNFQDFTRTFNRYYGPVSGNRNVSFRLVSDFLKTINRTDLIHIGDPAFGILPMSDKKDGDLVPFETVWRLTLAAGLAMRNSGRTSIGSYKLAVSTEVTKRVIEELPLPKYQGSPDQVAGQFRQWIDSFIQIYNKHHRIISLSQVSVRMGGTLVRDRKTQFEGIDEKTYRGLDRALEKVYGDHVFGAIFPVQTDESYEIIDWGGSRPKKGAKVEEYPYGAIREKWFDRTLTEFIMFNRIHFKSEGGDTKAKAIQKRIANGTYTPIDIVYLCADRRSKQLGDYSKKWLSATNKLFDVAKTGKSRKYIRNGKIDDRAVSDEMRLFYLMGPDMYDYYGMTSAGTFYESYWGKKFINAKSVDEFRSLLFSMMIEYRLSPSQRVLQSIEDAKADQSENADEIEQLIEHLDARYEQEMDILASSSMAWKTIVDEMTSGDKVFKSLIEKEGVHKSRWTARAGKFWSDQKKLGSKGYKSLIDFLKSKESYELKAKVLADVVRAHEEFANIDASEMIGQLAHHPDRLHAGDRFDMDSYLRDDIDAIKDSIDAVSTYHRSQENLEKEAEEIVAFAKENPNEFARLLARMASDPGFHVYIDPVLAADAIASVYDPTYDDSNKGSQQARVNGYFGSLSLQRNGGFYTHLQQKDNAVINYIGYDQISVYDVIRVLGDPSYSFTVYDEFGCATRIPVSRKTLCCDENGEGGESIEDVIKYIEKHPRIAVACQRFACGVNDDVHGTARMNSMGIEGGPDSMVARAFSILNDRPRFLAISALVTPAYGDVGRNLAERNRQSLENLCAFVVDLALNGITLRDGIAERIEETLGITEDRIQELRRENIVLRGDEYAQAYYDFFPTDEEFDAVAPAMVDEVVTEIMDCVGLVTRSFYIQSLAGIGIEPGWDQVEIAQMSIDESSIPAYFAAKQQLSGSRTERMIGVEGQETGRNQLLKEYLRRRKPDYTTYDGVVERFDRLPEETQFFGQSLERNPTKQKHPVSKRLEVTREKAAEGFLMKTRRYGDDGTNSIIKYQKMTTRNQASLYGKTTTATIGENGLWTMEDGQELMARLMSYTEESRDQAVADLARALIEADTRLGYIETEGGVIIDGLYQESDYYETANLMIAFNSDGSIVIRSLEQIATALNHRLSDEAIESESVKEIDAEIEQIIDVLGTDRDPVLALRSDREIAHSVLMGIRTHSAIGDRTRVSRALDPLSSSSERNAYMLWRLYEKLDSTQARWADKLAETAKRDKNGRIKDKDTIKKIRSFRRKAAPLSKERTEKRMNDILRSIEDKSLKEALVGVVIPEEGRRSRRYLYDIVGTATDMSKEYIAPGATNLVLFPYLPGTKSEIAVLETCREYGMTAAFDGMSSIPEKYLPDAIQLNDRIWIVPFFDMALNGSRSGKGVGPAPSEYTANISNLTLTVESTSPEFGFGDGEFIMTQELVNRRRICIPGRPQMLTVERLFPNVLARYPDLGRNFTIDYCDRDEIECYIVNGQFDKDTMRVHGFSECEIDLGLLSTDDNRHERERQRFALRLEEYKSRFDETNEEGMIVENCYPDSIIGFVKIVIDGDAKAFAPIWPFHIEESGMAPQRFSVTDFYYDQLRRSFVLKWLLDDSLEGYPIKYFEGAGSSSKFIASDNLARSRALSCGLPVDGFFGKASVGNRFFSSNKRLQTIITMLNVARAVPQYGYNIGDVEGVFPEIKDETITINETEMTVIEAVRSCAMGMTDWADVCKWDGKTTHVKFHDDQEIDTLIRWFVSLCLRYGTVNPTTILCTKSDKGILGMEDDQYGITMRFTEWEAFMHTSLEWQNTLMKLINIMSPRLCPAGINEDSSGCLFHPVTREMIQKDKEDNSEIHRMYSDDDYGTLQVIVPYYHDDGIEYHLLQTAYLSFGFFGEDYLAIKRPNINAYSRSLDNLSVAYEMTGRELSELASFARSGMSSVPRMSPGSFGADLDDAMMPIEDMIAEYSEKEQSGKLEASEADIYKALIDFKIIFDMVQHHDSIDDAIVKIDEFLSGCKASGIDKARETKAYYTLLRKDLQKMRTARTRLAISDANELLSRSKDIASDKNRDREDIVKCLADINAMIERIDGIASSSKNLQELRKKLVKAKTWFDRRIS